MATNKTIHWAILFFRFQPNKQSDSTIPLKMRDKLEALLAAVVLGATTVSITLVADPFGVTKDGDSEQEDPARELEQVSATVPANPLAGVTVRLIEPLAPCASVIAA